MKSYQSLLCFLIENICFSLKTLILKGQGPSAVIKTQKLLFTIGLQLQILYIQQAGSPC